MIHSTTAETILVVDDQRPLCELIEVVLCTAGYRVLTAFNGSDALRIARSTPRIDLLVTDLEMPQMRGDELATRFARLHPATPVLFVTSSSDAILTSQPYHFRAKPFTVTELRESVREALHAQPVFAEASRAA